MDFVNFIHGEWKVISEAPFIFITGAILIALAVWAFVRHQFSERLETLDSRLTLKDEQLAAYKDKLNGASPDEARQRIDALEQKLSDLSNLTAPRTLGDNEMQIISRAVSVMSGKVVISCDATCSDAPRLARQYGAALTRAGWTASFQTILGVSRASKTGISLVVQDRDNLDVKAECLNRALAAAGILFEAVSVPQPPTDSERPPEILITQPIDD